MESTEAKTKATLERTPRAIVCIYSQEDEPFYLQLKKSLNLWERHGQMRWLEVLPGEEPAIVWKRDVQHADLILLLLSPDFFPDELCYQTMQLALQERASRQAQVVPILIRAVNWRLSACKDLAIVPHNEQPVASWVRPDEAYASIGADLARLVPGWPPIPSPTRPRLFQARDLPKNYVARPKAFDAIKYLLLNREGTQTTAITTALRGAGGFGKTMLALCHDLEIQAAFPDGIFWVELGEQPPRALDVLNGLLVSLEAPHHGAITLEEARERWRTALQDRVCLLVIDDVWQAVALEPLLEGGPQCVRLVTTRNDQVLPEETKRIWVDAMEPEEAIAMLHWGLPDEIKQQMYQSALKMLVERLGCWPLLLSLAHGMLVTQVSYGLSIPEALTIVEKAYQTRGVTAFHLGHASERQRTADTCLEVSLQHVEEFTRAHYQAAARYQELAVFPEDTDIPLTTLQIFWKATGGLEPWETQDLCIHLHRLSLLLTCDLGKATIRLHDVLRSYLVQRAGSHLPALHMRLLDAHRQVLGLKRWADLPPSDRYLWQHLVRHLCHASRTEELQTTLTDLGYLTRKALYVGVPALEADFLLASTFHAAAAVEPVSSFFASLHRNIMRISHLLQQVQTPTEMGGLLLSLLSWEPAFAAQRSPLEEELPRPFLTAWHPLPSGASPTLLRTLHGHADRVSDCTVSPDGRWIVSASHDKTLKVWDAATGAERLTLQGHREWVTGCAVSPDGRWIVSASDDETLKVWNATTGAEHLTLSGHTNEVAGCAVSPDGSFIVSASTDTTLKVWNVASGAELRTLRGHTSTVSNCAVSPDNRWIISASYDETLKVWDAATGAERLTLQGHTSAVSDCAVSPDGRWIVSASLDHTLKVWDAATGAERLTLHGHTSSVNGCAVSPDGRWIVSASGDLFRSDYTLKVWDAATGAERFTLSGHTSQVNACAVSPDGQWIISASGGLFRSDYTLKVWDAATGAERFTLSGHTDEVAGCAVSPDGSFIVSASDDTTLRVWDAATGAERFTLHGHTHIVKACVVSPDSRWIVSASYDKTLKVWDAATGAERFTLSVHTSAVSDCAVSPDGRWIVSASHDKTLKVWDAATGAERLTLQGRTNYVLGCAMSPDGSFIVSASNDKTLKVWNATTGAEHLTLSGHTNEVAGCAVSPDGSFIVSASDDTTLRVWDAVTGAERFTLHGHTSSVNGCAVSPDGRWIVSASHDKTLKIWDVQTGQCLLTFPVDGALLCCAFHPDGEHLVACGDLGMYFLRLVK